MEQKDIIRKQWQQYFRTYHAKKYAKSQIELSINRQEVELLKNSLNKHRIILDEYRKDIYELTRTIHRLRYILRREGNNG